eukprot:TRINITY_DN931_c0_g3_i1.p1 TRINITY_DN931_c0_g3~~TRINITY_DN931_c0_g3_i1.p1  ORF type:complete len:713 (-),score=104.30 TRINITY_DN931_c0_g3_i1:500-2638(-)
MFWNVPGYGMKDSPIEGILNKDKFSLEDLFEEDELVQEAKAMNGRLVAFLKDKAILQKLVKYLVVPEEAYQNGNTIQQNDEDDLKEEEEIQRKLQRYPYLACELICCEVEGILSNLVQTEDLMNQLFSLLEQPRPINSTLAGYFGRVMSMLLVKRTLEFMSYMHSHVSHLFLLVDHIDITSVQEIILRLTGADEQINMNLTISHKEWLADSQLLPELVKRVSGNFPPETQTNAAEVLSTIASTQPSLLASKLSDESILVQLVEQALQWQGSILVPALGVFISLLQPMNNESIQQGDFEVRTQSAVSLVQYVPQIATLLNVNEEARKQQELKTSYGVLNPPLGWGRLRVVEFFAALVGTGVSTALEGVMAQGLIPQCMELFQQYPFNNLLHQAVVTMLATGIEMGSAPFMQYVFQQCMLVQWMTQLPKDVLRNQDNKDGGVIRAGYHGHITSLGLRLCQLAKENEDIKNELENNPKWPPYFVHVLQPRFDKENTAHWACGRPAHNDMSMNSETSDQEDFQDGPDFDISMPDVYNPYNMLDEDLGRGEDEEEQDRQVQVEDEEETSKQKYQQSFFLGDLQPVTVISDDESPDHPQEIYEGEGEDVIIGDEEDNVDYNLNYQQQQQQGTTFVTVSFGNIHQDLAGKMQDLSLQDQQQLQQNQQNHLNQQQLQQTQQERAEQTQQQEIQSSNPDDFSDTKYWKSDSAFTFDLPELI